MYACGPSQYRSNPRLRERRAAETPHRNASAAPQPGGTPLQNTAKSLKCEVLTGMPAPLFWFRRTELRDAMRHCLLVSLQPVPKKKKSRIQGGAMGSAKPRPKASSSAEIAAKPAGV